MCGVPGNVCWWGEGRSTHSLKQKCRKLVGKQLSEHFLSWAQAMHFTSFANTYLAPWQQRHSGPMSTCRSSRSGSTSKLSSGSHSPGSLERKSALEQLGTSTQKQTISTHSNLSAALTSRIPAKMNLSIGQSILTGKSSGTMLYLASSLTFLSIVGECVCRGCKRDGSWFAMHGA